MAKVRTLDECVVELDGVRKCAFCGTELEEGEVCTCNRYKLVLRNLYYIGENQKQVDHYKGSIDELYERMPEPAFGIREAIVALPPTPEPPAEDDGGEENTEGGE